MSDLEYEENAVHRTLVSESHIVCCAIDFPSCTDKLVSDRPIDEPCNVKTDEPVAAVLTTRILLSSLVGYDNVLDTEPTRLDRVRTAARDEMASAEALHRTAVSENQAVFSHGEFPMRIADERDKRPMLMPNIVTKEDPVIATLDLLALLTLAVETENTDVPL